MDPVPEPLLLRKTGSVGNQTRYLWNSDHRCGLPCFIGWIMSHAGLTFSAADPQKLALTSPTSGGRLVGIVRSRTQAMEFVCFV
jgi:hypothetical protein